MNTTAETGRNSDAERMSVERIAAHASLERGDADAYANWLKSTGDRQDVERPGTRRDAARGYVAAFAEGDLSSATKIKKIFAFQPEEIERTGVRERAESVAPANLTAGNFAFVRYLYREELLPPSFFSQSAIVEAARHGVTKTFVHRTPQGRADVDHFAALLDLPLPPELISRAQDAAARPTIAIALRKGVAGAPDLMRRAGFDRTNADPSWVQEARAAVPILLATRDVATAESFANAFGFDLAEFKHSFDMVTGYERTIAEGELSVVLEYERLFPSLRERQAGYSIAICAGLAHLWSNRQQSAAEAFMRNFHPDERMRVEAAKLAAKTALTEANGRTMDFLRDTLRVPSSVMREAANDVAEECLASWRTEKDRWPAMLGSTEDVRRLARLRREDLADGMARGMARRYRVLTLEAKGTQVNLAPAKEAAAYFGIPARAVGTAFLVENFLHNEAARNGDVRSAFGLGQADAELAAMRASVFALERWDGREPSEVVARSLASVSDPESTRQNQELRRAASRFVQSEYEKLRPHFASPLAELMGFSASELRAIGERARPAAWKKMVEDLRLFKSDERSFLEISKPDEMLTAVGLTWDHFSPGDIPFQCVVTPPRHPEFRAVVERDPWWPGIQRALKVQGRSANLEHDAWLREGNPMLESLLEAGILSRDSASDANLIVEYAKTFGLVNLPRASAIFFRLKRGPFSALPEDDKRALVEVVGPKAARLEGGHLINELRKLRADVQSDLVGDRIPRKLETVLGGEMFQTARGGSSSWEQEDRPEEILRAWKQTVAHARASGRREDVEVASGYEETTLTVPKIRRPSKKLDPDARRAMEQEILRGVAFAEWTVRLDGARNRCELVKRAGVSLPEFPALGLDVVQDLSFAYQPEDGRFINYMESIAALPEAEETLELLQTLSLLHVQCLDMNWSEAVDGPPEPGREAAAAREISEFLRQYLVEHYLSPGQSPSHTGHRAFSERLRLAIAKAWGLENGLEEHAVVKVARRLADLEPKREYSEETVDIALVPAQGMARIYAGEIGDACYSSQHRELADGNYPRIKANLFVTNRGKPKERLNGSVLFVETRMDPEEENRDDRVLVVRANNPRQNLVAQVDARELVRQTVQAAIATARRRKIRHVGVVLDEASMASSNREEIASAYAEAYAGNVPAHLVDEPVTNFNGYPIWNPRDGSPTVLVWTNDDPKST